jgi:hypothetical protein
MIGNGFAGIDVAQGRACASTERNAASIVAAMR